MFSVILAGGSGTRFWPMSRKDMPKQFLNITGRGPMVVETCDRLTSLSGDEEMILLLGEGHLDQAKRLFGSRRVHMLGEPVGRNTAPAIGLGAAYAKHLGCAGAVAFLPADHYIGDAPAFVEALGKAALAAEAGGIVTLGIVPVRPETGYGYICRDPRPLDAGSGPIYRVREFVEKPDLEKARGYLSSGRHYWNAGIFIATPETILNEIGTHLPRLHEALVRLTVAFDRPDFASVFREAYASLEAVSFDYGIMEKTREKIYVIPCECGWSDVGSWESLYELKRPDRDENQNLAEGDALPVECRGSFISSDGGRFVACLGLENCLVVDTPDILLVADLRRSQDIRNIVDRLKETKREKLL